MDDSVFVLMITMAILAAGCECCGDDSDHDGYDSGEGTGTSETPVSSVESCLVGQTMPCPNQEGVCGGHIKVCTCIDSCRFSNCDYASYSPKYEGIESICDGLDNDCDSEIDEMTQPCPVQRGVCAGSVSRCYYGKWTACDQYAYGADYENPEAACDNLDNDCDGAVDEECS